MNASGTYPRVEILGESIAPPLEELLAEELSSEELVDVETERLPITIPAPPIDFAEFQKSQEYRDFWTLPRF